MQQTKRKAIIKSGVLMLATAFVFSACDRSSSPEGRMSIQIEQLRDAMLDSLQDQNKAILDSLSSIRQEINQLRQQNN